MELDQHLKIDAKTCDESNLIGHFAANDLPKIAGVVWQGYNQDKDSRVNWERRTQAAMDLALQLQKDKSFPWQGASNVAFPLVTIAALQFHARAYPATVSGTNIVRYRVADEDPTGELQAKATRIGRFLSYQVLEEDEAWEEQHDRLLITLPIVGCDFKKSYYCEERGCPVAESVSAMDLVVDYYAKSIETATRKTHVIRLSRNQVYERCASGAFKDIREEGWFLNPAVGTSSPRADQRTGTQPPSSPDEGAPFTFLEQHCWMDLDGDGYQEPYIITIEAQSQCLVRVVARWGRKEDVEMTPKGEVIRIHATEHFTKFGFIPSPDKSIYDIGFGVLMGPLNESVNSLINQLIDAGSMSVAAGGFMARGVKTRGGSVTFSPFGWQRVDATGDDLRKGIFPLPVREPSTVLFQLLSLLINYAQRISGSTDMLAGENPGQNTPAETSRAMVEQGMKIYNSLFKRVWRSMKAEFKVRYQLNAVYLPASKRYGSAGDKAMREDFLGDPRQVCPVADPNMASDSQRMQQAVTIKQAAASTPGYDVEVVERNFLQAMGVDGIDRMYPGPSKVPAPKDVKIQIEEMRQQAAQMELQWEKQKFLADLMEQHHLNLAQIALYEGQAAKAMAEAKGAEVGHQIAMLDAFIGTLKTHDESLQKRIALILEERKIAASAHTPEGGVPRVATPPRNQSVPELLGGPPPAADGGVGAG